jgi:hypothetical protein
MTKDELIRRFPRLYHMSETGSWPSIQKHGLLSTTALLDLYEISGKTRYMIESNVRRESVRIQHPKFGKAIIRDQRALCDKPSDGIYLKDCLDSISVEQWCEFLNRRTFFWLDKKRLFWMLNSYMYQNRPHWVIIVDTQLLVGHYEATIALCDTNSGSIWNAKKRGISSFKSIKDYMSRYIAELAVEYSVPNISELSIAVEEWKRDTKIRTIWENQISYT